MPTVRLTDHLLRWEQMYDAGRDVPASELCPGEPALAAELQHAIDDRKHARLSVTATLPPADLDVTVPPVAGDGRAAALAAATGAPPGYEVLGELGRGGMGVVYRARQAALGREVALKMILAGGHAGADERLRFLAEAEAIAKVRHPGIVQVYDYGTHQGLPYFSLELCPGGSLADRLREGPLPPREAAALVERTARAVQAAHDAGVVHRDLKPANVLLTAEGEPRVTDFGLAKRAEGGSGLTVTGAVMGTPSYMAPEQAEGRKDVGPPADIYALGAVLYECLTGRPPFRAATTFDTILQVVSEDPVPPRQLNKQVPRDVETVCLKCLQKSPGQRYVSAADLAEDLQRWLAGEPVRARPVGRVERLAKWARRNPAVAGLLTAMFVLLTAGVTISSLLAVQARRAADRADHSRRALSAALEEKSAALDKEQQERTRRALAQVEALLTASPQAVPALLDGLARQRKDVLPRLREVWALPDTPANRPRRMRAALALLPVEPERVKDDLARWVLEVADPAELIVARDALAPHASALAERFWKQLKQPATTQSQRLRLLAALAAFDPDAPGWKEAAGQALEAWLADNPLYLGVWAEALRPARDPLLRPLTEVFRGQRLPERRAVVASILADYLRDRPEALADRLMDADQKQFGQLFEAMEKHRTRAVELFAKKAGRATPEQATEADREALAQRQANAGLALLRLGEAGPVWPLLKHSPYPEARSRLVALMAPGGVEAPTLVGRLEVEKDVSTRRALILALGELTPEQVPAELRRRVGDKLVAWYRDDADSGMHGAIDWLLRYADEGPDKRKLDWGRRKDLERIDDEQAAQARRLALAGGAAQLGLAARGWLPLAGALLAPQARPSAKGWHVNGQGQTLTVVDGREPFLMGSPEGEAGRRDDENQHWRKVGRRYAVQTKPVTVAQWERFQKAVPQVPRFNIKEYAPEPECPMISVSWYDAAAYCRWLSEQEGVPEHEMVYPPVKVILDAQAGGKALRLSAGHLRRSGYRLPSEAEWELACRAGARTSRYYGSSLNLLPRYGWSLANSMDQTWPVGQKRPNDLGLFEMHGNVWTWCQDGFDNYPAGTRQAPAEDKEEENIRDTSDRLTPVLRGGSYLDRAPTVRSSFRNFSRPWNRNFSNGLRVCRTLPPRP